MEKKRMPPVLPGAVASVTLSVAHTNYLAYNLDAGGDHWVGLEQKLKCIAAIAAGASGLGVLRVAP
jgi:hypothetical protein